MKSKTMTKDGPQRVNISFISRFAFDVYVTNLSVLGRNIHLTLGSGFLSCL